MSKEQTSNTERLVVVAHPRLVRFLHCDGCGKLHEDTDDFVMCDCGRVAVRMEWATSEQIADEYQSERDQYKESLKEVVEKRHGAFVRAKALLANETEQPRAASPLADSDCSLS